MVNCKVCNREMTDPFTITCKRKHVMIGGVAWPKNTSHFDELSGRCHDCGIEHGGYHHTGCDVERCPKCNGQLITCGC